MSEALIIAEGIRDFMLQSQRRKLRNVVEAAIEVLDDLLIEYKREARSIEGKINEQAEVLKENGYTGKVPLQRDLPEIDSDDMAQEIADAVRSAVEDLSASLIGERS
jgi:hypothetical protein